MYFEEGAGMRIRWKEGYRLNVVGCEPLGSVLRNKEGLFRRLNCLSVCRLISGYLERGVCLLDLTV